MAAPRFAPGDAVRKLDRLAQLVGQVESGKLIAVQFDQLLPKRLQRVHLPFKLALARELALTR